MRAEARSAEPSPEASMSPEGRVDARRKPHEVRQREMRPDKK